MNLIYVAATQKYHIPGRGSVKNSGTVVSAALTSRIYAAQQALVEGMFVGVEAHLLSLFDGLALNQNLGNALFVGPTLAIAFQGERMLNVTWTPQVAGARTSGECARIVGLGQLRRSSVPCKV